MSMLVCLCLNTSLVFAEDFKFYIVDNAKDETTDLPRRSVGDDLFVSYHGQELLISNENFSYMVRKEILSEIDLDGDGYKEVILEMHNGGNCCGSEYALVSYRGENFFSIIEHEDLSGAAFPKLEIVEIKGKPLLKVVNLSEGVGNVSQDQYIILLELSFGQLNVVSNLKNSALLPSIIEVNAHDFDRSNPVPITKSFDADGDGLEDRLVCRYWDRWGSTVCDIESSKFGLINTNMGCDRLGVLSSNTNGLVDLVCNSIDTLKFNQNKYEVYR